MYTATLRLEIAVIAFVAATWGIVRGDDAKLEDQAAQDAKQLQGEWRWVEVEMEGKQIGLDVVTVWKDRRMIVEANNLTATSGEPGLGDRKKTFKLNAKQSPKHLDMTSLDGNEQGVTEACIYALEGDRLRMCIPYFHNRVDPSKRPTEFKTKDGDGLMLYVLERVKKESP